MHYEKDIQALCVSWFKTIFPGVLIFSIPNERVCSKAMMAKLVAMGLTKGVPDLFIPSLKLFIEFKTRRGSLSKYQKDISTKLKNEGYCVETVHSIWEFKAYVQKQLSEQQRYYKDNPPVRDNKR